MRIVVTNLPDDITEEAAREALGKFAPTGKITLHKDSGAPTAVIEMEMTPTQADNLVRRIEGRIYKGRKLGAWVPLGGWN